MNTQDNNIPDDDDDFLDFQDDLIQASKTELKNENISTDVEDKPAQEKKVTLPKIAPATSTPMQKPDNKKIDEQVLPNDEDDQFLDIQDDLVQATNANLNNAKVPESRPITSTPTRDGDEDALDEEFIGDRVQVSSCAINYESIGSTYTREQESKRVYQDIKKSEAKLTALGKLIFIVIMTIAALLGFKLVTEFVAFWGNIQNMPDVLRWSLFAALSLFSLILLWVVGKLCFSMVRFKRAGGLDIGTVKSLAGIDQFKDHAQRDFARYQKELVARLKSYQASTLLSYQASDEEIEKISTAKEQLLGSSLGNMSPENWIDRYVVNMEEIIQSIAQRRIRTYSMKVAASTAISPFPLIDQLIVLSSTLAMTQDLFSIYHLKLNKMDNLKLLGLAISNTYFASVAQDYSVQAMDGIANSLLDPDYLSQMGTAAVLGKTVGAKASEGVVNGFLIWRIGKYINKRLTLCE